MYRPNLIWLERLTSGLGSSRRVMANFGKLAFVMVKGAYLVEERRRLFEELGTKYYEQFGHQLVRDETLQKTIQHIERLSKKIETEEILIRQFRFGYRPRRKPRQGESHV